MSAAGPIITRPIITGPIITGAIMVRRVIAASEMAFAAPVADGDVSASGGPVAVFGQG